MLYRKVKKTGDSLSILGYGCMRFPEKNGRIDKDRATKQIHYAIDKGVNYFDTGYFYHNGQSEVFLGEVLSKGLRNKIKLATKLPAESAKKPEDMDDILNNQLKRLKTDHIDYYLLHGVYDTSWKKFLSFDVLNFLDKAKKDGRIINAGFSFHGGRNLFKEIVDAYNWQICLIQYNYFDQDTQAGTEGLEYAASKDLGIMVMEPLMGGLLSNKVPSKVKKIWDKSPIKRTPAEWSFRWIWNRPEINVVLSGMNEESHIEENINIASNGNAFSLTDEELKLVEEVKLTYENLMKIRCAGCRYCMPCPVGINISFCFEVYNRVKSFGEGKLHNLFRYVHQLGGFEGANRMASKCIECGKCLKKCPQNIAIPERLKEVKKEFETFMLWIVKIYGKMIYSRARKK